MLPCDKRFLRIAARPARFFRSANLRDRAWPLPRPHIRVMTGTSSLFFDGSRDLIAAIMADKAKDQLLDGRSLPPCQSAATRRLCKCIQETLICRVCIMVVLLGIYRWFFFFRSVIRRRGIVRQGQPQPCLPLLQFLDMSVELQGLLARRSGLVAGG